MDKRRSGPAKPYKPDTSNCLNLRGAFRFCADRISHAVGTAWAFVGASFLIVVWIVTGPLFKFSDTWQLVINTATTIVTFLMVFLIQNTQNRDTKAIHLKLDELLRSIRGARNSLVSLENLSDDELDELQQEFDRLRERGHSHSAKQQSS